MKETKRERLHDNANVLMVEAWKRMGDW